MYSLHGVTWQVQLQTPGTQPGTWNALKFNAINECPFFLVLSAVTLESWHWRHCYSSWTNRCWKLGILTSQHGLLQPSSQRAATNALCFFSKMNPWSNLSIIICRNFQVANLKSSTGTYTAARLISSPAQLEHMFWVCVCIWAWVIYTAHRGHRKE